jgi:hypothetical protein
MRIALAIVLLCVAGSWCFAEGEPPSPRPAAPTLTPPRGANRPVDARGFIHRWLVLEPVPVAGRLTEPAVQEALQLAALPDADQALPNDGDVATVNGSPLRWHAVDTTNYNVNLFHFAWALSKPTSNVLFWVVTTVDSPREMTEVRLAIGSNAASRWWLNGEPVIALNDDRQSVIDDGVSRRLTLHKGRNVIRASIINGGGATDFCARFLDGNDQPISGLTAALPVASGTRAGSGTD